MTFRPFNVLIDQAVSNVTSTKGILFNNTGVTIVGSTPVRLNSSGQIATINPSIESNALAVVGVVETDILASTYGNVVTQGRISNITTGFAFGDYVYVSKIGDFTNILPSEGVNGFIAGDFIIRVGVIAKNDINPAYKDLFVSMQVVGQI